MANIVSNLHITPLPPPPAHTHVRKQANKGKCSDDKIEQKLSYEQGVGCWELWVSFEFSYVLSHDWLSMTDAETPYYVGANGFDSKVFWRFL